MTRNPDKYHLSCAAVETITADGTDNGSGATVAYDLSCDGKGPGLPAPFSPPSGTSTLSIAVAFPGAAGGSYVVTLTSSTGEKETYRFTQVHNPQDGAMIEFKVP